jgi:glycosyltransferase involved in cell wall biosynthesis
LRIIVATTHVPFRPAPQRRLAAALTNYLRGIGHQADTVSLPFHPDAPSAEQLLAYRLIDLAEPPGGPIDRLITLGAPATLLPHPRKAAWLIEPYPAFFGHGLDSAWPPQGQRLPEDRACAELAGLREARRVFAASAACADWLKAKHGLAPIVTPPPPPDCPPPPPPSGATFAVLGPLAPVCRHLISLEALRFAAPQVRLVFTGPPADKDHAALLRRRAEEWGLMGRVSFEEGTFSADCVAAVTFGAAHMAPEDGLLEAFAARRTAITADDCHPTVELVEHEPNGLIVAPDPRALAWAMGRLCTNLALARSLGEAAHAILSRRRITWAHVAEQLLR